MLAGRSADHVRAGLRRRRHRLRLHQRPKEGRIEAGAGDRTKEASAQPIAPRTAAVQVRSPYQQPIPPQPGEPLAAAPVDSTVAAPGTPPVEFGPVRKLKARRVPSDEPIDPYERLGTRAGAFIFYPAIELTGGYDSNPENATNGKSVVFGTVAPELRLQSAWSRHELKANLFGG
jgi:hypothetical protein